MKTCKGCSGVLGEAVGVVVVSVVVEVAASATRGKSLSIRAVANREKSGDLGSSMGIVVVVVVLVVLVLVLVLKDFIVVMVYLNMMNVSIEEGLILNRYTKRKEKREWMEGKSNQIDL